MSEDLRADYCRRLAEEYGGVWHWCGLWFSRCHDCSKCRMALAIWREQQKSSADLKSTKSTEI